METKHYSFSFFIGNLTSKFLVSVFVNGRKKGDPFLNCVWTSVVLVGETATRWRVIRASENRILYLWFELFRRIRAKSGDDRSKRIFRSCSGGRRRSHVNISLVNRPTNDASRLPAMNLYRCRSLFFLNSSPSSRWKQLCHLIHSSDAEMK